MRLHRALFVVRLGSIALGGLCFASPGFGQNAAPCSSGSCPTVTPEQNGALVPRPTAAGASPDLRALTDSIRELQSQVQSLSVQVGELRAAEQRSNEETRELRRELEQARLQQPSVKATAQRPASDPYGSLASGAAAMTARAGAAAPEAASATQAASSQTLEQRVANLEEGQQLADAKINDQYQTKVESGAKYRVRLSGMVLVNLFENRGTVDNLDFPEFASLRQPIPANGSFGGTVRQSQVGLEMFGPDIAGAHTRADVKFDFAGGFPPAAGGFSTGEMRLRTGTIHFDWQNTSVIAGQDYLFFSPLDPTSLASIAVPAFSYSGNLWAWTPQVRIEHRFRASESSNFTVGAGILDSMTGEASGENDRTPLAGERSGQPAYAARISWTRKTSGREMTIGIGGYSARQNWGFGRTVDGWAGTTDVTLPLGKYFDFSGEFYRGRSVGGIGGGIGESVLLRGTGMLNDPNAPVHALDSMGGWAQIKFTPVQKLQFNAVIGQDNPFAREFAGNFWSQNFTYELLKKNMSWMGNFIYQPRSNVLFSLEYRRLRTLDAFRGLNFGNQISLSTGYIF